MTELRDYITRILELVEAAGERGDRVEAIRLLRLMRDEGERQAQKLEGA